MEGTWVVMRASKEMQNVVGGAGLRQTRKS